VKQRRYTGYSDRSSDGFDVDDEDEDEEEEDNDDIVSEEVTCSSSPNPVDDSSRVLLPSSFFVG